MGRWGLRCQGRTAAVSELKRDVTITMLLGGHMARHGCGGGTASTMDAIRNNVPHAAAAYFARMEVFMRQQGGGIRGNDD